jgi:hypothetical protein
VSLDENKNVVRRHYEELFADHQPAQLSQAIPYFAEARS